MPRLPRLPRLPWHRHGDRPRWDALHATDGLATTWDVAARSCGCKLGRRLGPLRMAWKVLRSATKFVGMLARSCLTKFPKTGGFAMLEVFVAAGLPVSAKPTGNFPDISWCHPAWCCQTPRHDPQHQAGFQASQPQFRQLHPAALWGQESPSRNTTDTTGGSGRKPRVFAGKP